MKTPSYILILLFSLALCSCENPIMARLLQVKKITFESNGGSHVSSQTVIKGERISEPKAPVWEGHSFNGWFTDNGTFEIRWNFSDIPEWDMTLYAAWDGRFLTPVAEDFYIYETGEFEYDGYPHQVIIKAKPGKTTGDITVFYQELTNGTYGEKTDKPPTAPGTYKVTFDVEADGVWKAAYDLEAGMLIIINNLNPDNQTPKLADYEISELIFVYDGNQKEVTIRPKTGSSQGLITVKYNGNTTAPSEIGTYAVTFDVAAATGWNYIYEITVGNLVIKTAAVQIGSTKYPTLNMAIATSTGTGTTTITLLENITAPEVGMSVETGYKISNNITIQGGNHTITASAGGFSLFTVNSGVTLTLGQTSTPADSLTISGGGVETASGRRGVSVSGGTLVMNSGVTISGFNNDNPTSGSGVYIGNSSIFTMNGGSIQGNNATNISSGGGGVYISGGTFTMNNGKIHGNNAVSGGGVYISSGTFNMKGGQIGTSGSDTANTATSGGGVYISSGTFTMSDGVIQGNIATSGGGGVYASGGNFTINGVNAEIKENTATNGSGGGVYFRGSTFTMSNGNIQGNTASTNGGGVFVSSGNFTMSGGTIQGNSASGSTGGGGVYLSSGTFTMSGGTIYGTDAPSPGGTSNTATSGNSASIYVANEATAKYSGSYEGNGTGSDSNTITTTNDTLPPLP